MVCLRKLIAVRGSIFLMFDVLGKYYDWCPLSVNTHNVRAISWPMPLSKIDLRIVLRYAHLTSVSITGHESGSLVSS